MQIPIIVHDLRIERPGAGPEDPPIVQVVGTYKTAAFLSEAYAFAMKQRSEGKLVIQPTTLITKNTRTQTVEADSLKHAVSQGYELDMDAINDAYVQAQAPPAE